MMRARPGRQAHDAIGLLDIGTSKTVCVIVAVPRVRTGDNGRSTGARVLGVGQHPSRGLRAGMVVGLDAAEQAVRAAVGEAERMAGVTLEDVVVGATCARLKSSTFTADARIDASKVVGEADVGRLLAAGRTYAEREGRTLLHMNCISYRLDDTAGIAEPRGLAGARLSANLHAVTADDAPLRNLLLVIDRAYLSAVRLVPIPLVSGLAATTEEERRLGVVCVDFGAGTTSLSIFAEGHLLANDVVPVGGHQVTIDIARALSAPVAEAERMKKDWGTLAKAVSDDHEVISYTLEGEDVPALYQTSKRQVRDLVRARMMGLLTHISERIERSGVAGYTQRMVLTGGASQLAGLDEFAADFFTRRPIRIARPMTFAGLPPDFSGPACSATVGLIHAAFDPSLGVRRDRRGLRPVGYLQRMGQWLRESF